MRNLDESKFIGERLRLALTELGITQAKFARTVGVNTRSMSNYMRGQLPDTRVLLAIREQYGLSLDWLLMGIGEMFPDRGREASSLSFQEERHYRTQIEQLKYKKRGILSDILSLLVELQSADRFEEAMDTSKRKDRASQNFVDLLTSAQGEDWDCLIAFLIVEKQKYMGGRMVDFESRYPYFSDEFIDRANAAFRSNESAIKMYEEIRKNFEAIWREVVEAV